MSVKNLGVSPPLIYKKNWNNKRNNQVNQKEKKKKKKNSSWKHEQQSLIYIK